MGRAKNQWMSTRDPRPESMLRFRVQRPGSGLILGLGLGPSPTCGEANVRIWVGLR